MATKSFRYAALALQVLEKILGSKFSVTGIEKIPKQPIMFVANHFTRAETFFVPYLIFKNTGRQVRCLADASLYHGGLGRFLESVGTISTRHKNRDNIILSDLITGQYDWMIYPEGSMLKSKEVINEHGFVNFTPGRVGPVRTGSAVLALKSQLYRGDIVEAFDKKDVEGLKDLESEFSANYQEYFRDISTQIVPLNITYYPLRPGENNIQKLAQRFIKKMPRQLSEELEIEGNLLLGAEINLHFGDPIDLAQYLKKQRAMVYQIPIIKHETKINLLLRYFKSRLTNEFMEKIYLDMQVNFDHIFAAALRSFTEDEVSISRLKRVIYLSGTTIAQLGKYRIHRSIYEDNLVKMFNDEAHAEFDSVFDLAKKQNLLKQISESEISINKDAFEKRYDFHEIRRENSLQVIVNEFTLLETANDIIRRNAEISDKILRKKVFEHIYAKDLEKFSSDYEIFFDKKFSKEKSVGSPFFLDATGEENSQKIGIVISHGYKAAPKEIEELAKYLNDFGFAIYATRLRGHGTAPQDLRDTTWQDWYDSMQRGYCALRNICSKIVIVGFSTGGLLALLSASKKTGKNLEAIVSINAALKLVDIKARMVPGINMWNEMLEKFRIEKGRFEYVDDKPENPQINYSRNYIRSVNQLEKLMNACEDNLKKISQKTLLIQANQDPVVNPQSAKMIFEKISAKEKFLVEMNFSNHCIVNGARKEEVFAVIKDFFSKLKIL